MTAPTYTDMPAWTRKLKSASEVSPAACCCWYPLACLNTSASNSAPHAHTLKPLIDTSICTCVPTYAFLAQNLTAQASLYTHHQYLAGFECVGLLLMEQTTHTQDEFCRQKIRDYRLENTFHKPQTRDHTLNQAKAKSCKMNMAESVAMCVNG